ncbi:MAG: BatA domain-containing protein [Verrucomicrobiales bacterium]
MLAQISFLNPFGFWFATSILVVVAIHFLQQRNQIRPVSTLFLIQKLLPESQSGGRWQHLRQSIPLWMQLLIATLITLLLAQPRWDLPTQDRVLVGVLDTSLSMEAAQEHGLPVLRDALNELHAPRAAWEYVLLGTNAGSPLISRTRSSAEWLSAFSSFSDFGGPQNPEAALRNARYLAGQNGVVVFLTDHPPSPDWPSPWLSYGQALPNIGFVGFESGPDNKWRAMVQNHSAETQNTAWRIANASDQVWQPLRLSARQSLTLTGSLPQERLVVELQPDALSWDNILYLLKPETRVVRWRNLLRDSEWVARLISALPHAKMVQNDADATVSYYDPLAPGWPELSGVVFVRDPSQPRQRPSGLVVRTNHQLVEDSAWEALLAPSGLRIPLRDDDQVLLWQEQKALIFVRHERGVEGQQDRQWLVFNFDPGHSNLLRIPSFPLLMHRWNAALQQNIARPWTQYAEPGQLLQLPRGWGDLDLTLQLESLASQEWTSSQQSFSGTRVMLPTQAGYFSIMTSDRTTLVTGAINTIDPRQGDLRYAAEGKSEWPELADSASAEQAYQPWWPWLGLLLSASLLLSWTQRRRRSS